MSANSESDNRFLDVSEKEMVSVTRSPEIERQSIEQLRALTHRLRQAHGRAKDISARQQREIRGKGDPRGAKRVQDNTGSLEKVRVLFEALQRVDEELSSREGIDKGTPSQAVRRPLRSAASIQMTGTSNNTCAASWVPRSGRRSPSSASRQQPRPPRSRTDRKAAFSASDGPSIMTSA